MAVVSAVDMVGVREAALAAQRDPETIRRWVRSGRLAAKKQGNRLLLSRAEVERLAGVRGSASVMTLAEWRDHVVAKRSTADSSGRATTPTAADLVLDDRAQH